MRAGKVVSMRVNPADCMSVIDVLEDAGFNLSQLGFSNAVSIVLSMLLEDRRSKGLIQRRLGFEYMNMMGKLNQSKGNTKIKTAISDGLYNNAQAGIYPAFEGMKVHQVTPMQAPANGGQWAGDMYLPPEYTSWDMWKKIAWQHDQQELIDAKQPVMQSSDEWDYKPPAIDNTAPTV